VFFLAHATSSMPKDGQNALNAFGTLYKITVHSQRCQACCFSRDFFDREQFPLYQDSFVCQKQIKWDVLSPNSAQKPSMDDAKRGFLNNLQNV